MAKELSNVEIVSRETIKPSFPTQNHNKFLKFSLFDQLAPPAHVSLLLFFSSGSDQEPNHPKVAERSQLLRKSLSQTLTSFYPFAGRISDNATGIDCNDEGVEFVETRVKCPLSTFMAKPDSNLLSQLYPDGLFSTEKRKICTIPLLVVQVNFFDCGGMAISVSVSHKAADASTISTIINCWAANASGSGVDSSKSAQFLSHQLFPPRDSFASLAPDYALPILPEKAALRRMAFRGPRVAALRKEVASSTVANPTRVEAVVALIWKCAMEASASLKSSSRPGSDHGIPQSAICHAVNFRRRLSPRLPENSCGNLSWVYTVSCTAREAELQDLVALLRKGIEEFGEGCDILFQREDLLMQSLKEFGNLGENGERDVYISTSWCGFPFYRVDFGWGNPLWVCVPYAMKNVIVLIDTRDGDGIEVLLSLAEEEMAYFERNPKLLEFASFNLSAV